MNLKLSTQVGRALKSVDVRLFAEWIAWTGTSFPVVHCQVSPTADGIPCVVHASMFSTRFEQIPRRKLFARQRSRAFCLARTSVIKRSSLVCCHADLFVADRWETRVGILCFLDMTCIPGGLGRPFTQELRYAHAVVQRNTGDLSEALAARSRLSGSVPQGHHQSQHIYIYI